MIQQTQKIISKSLFQNAFAYTFIILTLGFLNQAKAADASLIGSFNCKSGYVSVCLPKDEIAESREARIRSVNEKMLQPALKAAYEVIDPGNEMPTDFSLDELSGLKKKSVRNKATKLFLVSIRKQMDSYLKEHHFATDFSEAKIKTSLAEIITKNVANLDTRKQILDIIRSIKLIALTEIDSENAPSNLDVIKLYKGCSKDNFTDNAFANEKKSGRFVVICPGEVIGSIEFAEAAHLPKDQFSLPLLMTIAHEIGHHFDYRYFPELYQGMLDNLTKYSDELKSKNIKDYMSELSADFWGLMVLRELPDDVSDVQRTKIYTGGLEDLCGTEDDGEHPSGQFRVDRLAVPVLCVGEGSK